MKRRGSTYLKGRQSLPGGGPIYITIYEVYSEMTGIGGAAPGSSSARQQGVNDVWQRGIQATNELNGADFYRYKMIASATDKFYLVGGWPQFSDRPITSAGGMEWNENLQSDDVFGLAQGGTNFNAVVVDWKELTGWTGRTTLNDGTPIFTSKSFSNLKWQYRNMNGSYSPFDTGYTINQQVDISNWYNVYIQLPHNFSRNFNASGYSYGIKVKQSGGGSIGRQQGKINGIYVG